MFPNPVELTKIAGKKNKNKGSAINGYQDDWNQRHTLGGVTMACSMGVICWLWICRSVPAWPFRAVCRPPLGWNTHRQQWNENQIKNYTTSHISDFDWLAGWNHWGMKHYRNEHLKKTTGCISSSVINHLALKVRVPSLEGILLFLLMNKSLMLLFLVLQPETVSV